MGRHKRPGRPRIHAKGWKGHKHPGRPRKRGRPPGIHTPWRKKKRGYKRLKPVKTSRGYVFK